MGEGTFSLRRIIHEGTAACVIAGSLLGTIPASAKVGHSTPENPIREGPSRATITDKIRAARASTIIARQRGAVDGRHLPSESPVGVLQHTASRFRCGYFVAPPLCNRFDAELPAGGMYTIRFYRMRNAARRNETATYTLEVGLSSGSKTLLQPRKRQSFFGWPRHSQRSGFFSRNSALA